VRMSSDHSRQSDPGQDEGRLGDLPAKSEHDEVAAARSGNLSAPVQVRGDHGDDDVIRIEDLTPREHVTGGRKIVLGEIITSRQEIE